MQPWPDCDQDTPADSAQLWTGRGNDVAAFADVARHHAETPWPSCGYCVKIAPPFPDICPAIARTHPCCCANHCADIYRCCVRYFPAIARTRGGCCPANARMFHRMLRRYFAGRYAEYCADIVRPPAIHSCKGMVSNQNDRLSHSRKPR